jgi:16S rRNA (uracil1498-N3)-methyltransferase
MPDFRAYAPDATADSAEIRLGPEESHHLVAVNRCGRGDPVVAFDGNGREWETECADPSRAGARLRVRSSRQAPPRTVAITLAQALPKGSAMDEIVRQATEIGAAAIQPLTSERTQVHLDGERAERKVEKWRTTTIEAAKQCGNPWLPAILPVRPFDAFVAAPGFDLKLVASLHAGARRLREILAAHAARHPAPPRRAVWLVGPEGDFSPAELAAALTHGFLPVTLGPLVLRSDTAAVYALSILSYELGG